MAEKNVKLFSNSFMAGAFALVNLVLVVLLLWTVATEYAPGFHCDFLKFLSHLPSEMVTRTGFSVGIACSEWKQYQREYYRLFAERADDPVSKQKILGTPLEIVQVWNPKLGVIDRCMTCHMGVSNPKMSDVPQPYKVHPNFTQHNFSEIGCAVCHEGQGPATTVHAAHMAEKKEGLEERFGPYDIQHAGWERPMLPLEYVQASCNKCHNVMEAPIPGADHLNAGWQLVQEKGCRTCHYIVDSGAKQAPELSTAGTKFYNASGYSEAFHEVRFGYLKESLRCPQANISHEAAEACRASLVKPVAPAGGASLAGADLVKKYQCTNCHSFDTPNRIVGPSLYDIGKRQDKAYIRESILEPNKVVVAGFPRDVMKATVSGAGLYKDAEQNPAIIDNLVTYLASLKGEKGRGAGAAGAAGTSAAPTVAAASAVAVMPNFNLNDEELHNVVTFLLSLQEHTVSWPQKSFAKKVESQAQAPAPGRTAFAGKSGAELVKLGGCTACHKIDAPGRLVGPSLWDVGARKDRAYIRESILEPDKVVVAGYPKGAMQAALTGAGFYQNISLDGFEKIVDYLAGLKGGS